MKLIRLLQTNAVVRIKPRTGRAPDVRVERAGFAVVAQSGRFMRRQLGSVAPRDLLAC